MAGSGQLCGTDQYLRMILVYLRVLLAALVRSPLPATTAEIAAAA